MIYLDNSATTQPSRACVDAMTELLCCAWGNPSSVHALGIEAEKRLKTARKQVAQALGVGCVLQSGGHQPAETLRKTGAPVVAGLREAAALILE